LNTLRKLAAKPVYYFAFPLVVGALLSTSLIQVKCPVCGGTGEITYSVGMENVHIRSLEPRILGTKQDACTGYIVTRALPVFTLSNSGGQDASGYLYLHLIDLATGQTLQSLHLEVQVPAQADTVLESEIAFAYDSIDKPAEDMDIKAEVVLDAVPCLACDGKGTVSLNAYSLTRASRDNFINTVRSSSQYGPEDWVILNGQRVTIGSKEWMDWMELN
jgi:hypothetical protein